MRSIKINATNSTNSFLKELAQNSSLDEVTIVVANTQTSGRGQMSNSWVSEPYKNLTFSIFTPLAKLQIKHKVYLNFAVSLAIYDTLLTYNIPKLCIKWPNDIMSAKKKICGILVETTFSHLLIKNTIIGIGLNVNQEKFSEELFNASSLKNILKKDIYLEPLMNTIVEKIEYRISSIESGKFSQTYEEYHNALYQRGIPTTFLDKKSQQLFMGIIIGVSFVGNLQIQLEDDTIVEYGLKEVSFAKV
ncbi:MAG: biotin--[acetyl-CoA-carboxylase] ligase [Flavobacteriaceae bacterium]|nr:biotin--[acetyl-CoA-carboxylase] ligase [Flavobacteriaceae bacterium]